MRFIYSNDVHGDKEKYIKLINLALEEKIEYLVIGGDLYPKGSNRIIHQPIFVNGWLEEYFQMLKDNNIKCILILGNDDLEELDDDFDRICDKFDNIYNIDRRKLDVEDVSFIGLPDVLDNPFARKNRVLMEEGLELEPQRSSEIYIEKSTKTITVEEWAKYRLTNVKNMKDVLEELPKPTEGNKAIYVLHDPPYGIGLDMCFLGKAVGSRDITEFLKNSNAYMGLHGHIHESPEMSGKWFEKLGNTICIQPGQTNIGEEKMTYVLIDTDKNEYKRFLEKIS